ncbi:uncharacterized protein BXIN_0385 [Babesia sp. Xinjiang]|uniref:uncharacterized protein n=1 Tax=Babesia sp. Xinjiang TaxID=462227 RepID=UPI000A234218|nr:uncharacterized protein BXIN_0385 [Babesia sp. Xinjiang]ORM41070.1 hypothetical protein BXIN_0385 [Babesia sp. Xinjiang]
MPEQQCGAIYFDGLGSIPTNMCQYRVTMSCDGKVASSPSMDMTTTGFNCVRWDHRFVVDIDDLWVDLNFVVRAEMDFNQFSQQQQHNRYNLSRQSNPDNQSKGAQPTQVSRGEPVHPDSSDSQHLESIYGKTKYVQRIGRAIISVPMLLDSLQLRRTTCLREGSKYGAASTEPGPMKFQQPKDDTSSGLPKERTTGYVDHTSSEGKNRVSDGTNAQSSIESTERDTTYRYKNRDSKNTGSFVSLDGEVDDSKDIICGRNVDKLEATVDVNPSNATTPSSTDAGSSQIPTSGHETDGGLGTSEGGGADLPSSATACDTGSDSGSKETTVPQVVYNNAEGDALREAEPVQSSGKVLNNTDNPEGDSCNDTYDSGAASPLQPGIIEDDVVASEKCQPTEQVDPNGSNDVSYGPSENAVILPVTGTTGSTADNLEKKGAATSHTSSSKDASSGKSLEREAVLQESEDASTEYPYFVETVMTLQLLPFNEHKWDDSKYVRPIEGYPSYGMKTPSQCLGCIDVRVRVYLRNRAQWLALRSCARPPKMYWHVPREFEMFHTSLIIKRMGFFLNSKPRWVDHILLPRWPYEHPCYIFLFWLILFDFMVFAPLPRKVLDVYLMVGIVSIFYRYCIGPMRYRGLCGFRQETATTSVTSASYSPNLSRAMSGTRVVYDDGVIGDTSSELLAPETVTYKVERARMSGASSLQLTPIHSDSSGRLISDRRPYKWDFRDGEGSNARFMAPPGYRDLSAQRYDGSHCWPIFADELSDTNLEDIVKLVVLIMQKAQVILGSVMLALDKLRFSLGCADSLSWLMVWVTLVILLIPLYVTADLLWRIPGIVWRLGIYIGVSSYCFTYHITDSIIFWKILDRIIVWLRFPGPLRYLSHWLLRAPDSREADHRAIATIQLIHN